MPETGTTSCTPSLGEPLGFRGTRTAEAMTGAAPRQASFRPCRLQLQPNAATVTRAETGSCPSSHQHTFVSKTTCQL